MRIRASNGDSAFYYTIKEKVEVGVRIERERIISEDQYDVLLTFRNQECATIKKKRFSFFWNEQYFEIDVFEEPYPQKGLVLMEAEYIDRHKEIKLPPFIKVVRNVTGDKTYSNKNISRASSIERIVT